MRNARSTELVTAATENAITLDEAKAHCRVDFDQDDAYLLSLIKVAQAMVEKLTWRKLITSTWKTHYDEFPCVIQLPLGNIQSITAIEYVDDAGASQTLSSSLYQTDLIKQPARISPAYNEDWPSTRDQMNAVSVEYVAGYGSASAVPEALKHAALLLIGHYYENREEVVIGTISKEIEFAFDALTQPYSLSLI